MSFEQKKNLIKKYFRYVDEGDIRIFDLYTEDVEIFFPKFGRHKGIEAMKEFSLRMSRILRKLQHDIDNLVFIDAGNIIVVEGREWGEMFNGIQFPDYKVSDGRFCNIFEFKDNLISSVKIYVDPDFISSDKFLVEALHH